MGGYMGRVTYWVEFPDGKCLEIGTRLVKGDRVEVAGEAWEVLSSALRAGYLDKVNGAIHEGRLVHRLVPRAGLLA